MLPFSYRRMAGYTPFMQQRGIAPFLVTLVGLLMAVQFTAFMESEGHWQETAPGIAVRTLHYRGDVQEEVVTAVRIEPARAIIRVVQKNAGVVSAGATASDICPESGAAINAPYFTKEWKPVGLLVMDGKVYHPLRLDHDYSVFWMRKGRPEILPRIGHVPKGVIQAIQSKPRLVVDNCIPTFKEQPATRRSAIGIDALGHVILAATDGDFTLDQWAECLRNGLGCVQALNLDGGPSTQLCVNGKFPAMLRGGWRVPVFITVEPKPAN